MYAISRGGLFGIVVTQTADLAVLHSQHGSVPMLRDDLYVCRRADPAAAKAEARAVWRAWSDCNLAGWGWHQLEAPDAGQHLPRFNR